MTDRIEREVTIHAPLERVWKLVTEPGWWIGDGDRSGQRHWRDGDLEVVEDPKYGRFPVRIEATRPQHYVAYRWAPSVPGQQPGEGNSTLVEFFLTEQEDGILLRVVESGFASLTVSDEERVAAIEGNADGWRQQLGIIKSAAE